MWREQEAGAELDTKLWAQLEKPRGGGHRQGLHYVLVSIPTQR
jgi:hypothetical protein